MRTVDIDTARAEIKEKIRSLENHNAAEASVCKIFIAALEYCLETLDKLPIINTEIEVLTATWELAGDSGYYQPYFRCSNCGQETVDLLTYCPNCGRYMREK